MLIEGRHQWGFLGSSNSIVSSDNHIIVLIVISIVEVIVTVVTVAVPSTNSSKVIKTFIPKVFENVNNSLIVPTVDCRISSDNNNIDGDIDNIDGDSDNSKMIMMIMMMLRK